MLDHEFTVTFFEHVSARFKREQTLNIDELRDLFGHTQAPSKDQLPLIKLARFGTLASAKGSLRHDKNVISISGIEADYDAGQMSFDDAHARLKWAGVSALIYESPSHTEAHPRWRVLAPFSKELEPARRYQMVARLNGVLGGVLAPESFTLSQAFYFGHVKDRPCHYGLARG